MLKTLTKQEVAEMRGVSISTVQKWIEKGWIKAEYKGGAWHIEPEQLEKFTPPKPGPVVKENDI